MTNVAEVLKQEFSKRSIPYKENQINLIVKCPVCFFRDGKEKLKLYIHKETGVFHCFRCGVKGNILKLSKLLNQYYNIDIQTIISIDELIEKSFSIQFLSETLKSIDKESVIQKLNQIKRNNKTLQLIYSELQNKDTKIEKKVHGYLLKRGIPITLLSQIPYFMGCSPNSKLYMRFGVMSFFYTNYEARTILPNIEPRYIQSDFKFESDFIFLPNRDNQLTKIIDQKLLYVNPEHYSESKIEFEEVYVVEGLFDALKLNLYLNKPVMSLGGWNKYKNSLLFIKMLETLFSTFRINKLIYLFDKDIEFNKIQVVADTILSYKSLLPIENVYFTKINSERYKDVGDIMNPEELKQILKQTINP